ncbi:MAG: hypothetical protein K2I87_03045, partial [Bacteroidales bacterium]|nr:hypothetical protein [Bacteroidales bacterium]
MQLLFFAEVGNGDKVFVFHGYEVICYARGRKGSAWKIRQKKSGLEKGRQTKGNWGIKARKDESFPVDADTGFFAFLTFVFHAISECKSSRFLWYFLHRGREDINKKRTNFIEASQREKEVG